MQTRFILGRYWLDKVPGSANWYRHWYDAGTGEVRRRSLKTSDIEQAKIKLAEIVLQEGEAAPREPSAVKLVTVLDHYRETYSEHRSNPYIARRASGLALDFYGNTAKVSELTKAKQKDFIAYLRKQGFSVGYISRLQGALSAAVNRAVGEDEGEGLLIRAPKIVFTPAKVAEILNEPEPQPDNWHPTLEQIAAFCDKAKSTEVLRACVLGLAFAGRPVAIRELSSDQFDSRYRLLAFNKGGRRQTKKFRPTLPVPPRLLQLMASLEPVRSVDIFWKEWGETLAAAKLPKEFRPKSLRHFMATMMRSRSVPFEQREAWMGHRRNSTNDRYGHFAPDYLQVARDCANAVLGELELLAKKDIYRQVSAKPTRQRFEKIANIGLAPTIASSRRKPKVA